MKFYLATLKTLWIFGLLSWAYVAAIILDPSTADSQTWPLSFYINIPTDLVGIIGFVVSFFSFLIYQWKKSE